MYFKRFKRYIFLLFAILFFQSAQAQFLGEIGLLGGVSYYNGDANSTTPFLENHPAAGALFRIQMHPLLMLKLDVLHATVSGNTENFPNALPNGIQAEFKRSFLEIGMQLEVNFFKYGEETWDREVLYHTPYILLGPGLAVYNDMGGNSFAPHLAFGVGYKYKLWGRWNIGLEWSMRKLFRDDFDVTDFSNEILNNPYGVKSSWLKNNDWYSCAFAFVTFDIIRKRGKCIETKW
ncbi:MAG: DUF6089 family protein [Prevotellaceae bacterium]|jgi:hypothetical protein|nr:DUF6089 family protein [Prevotellaceae bacterium]